MRTSWKLIHGIGYKGAGNHLCNTKCYKTWYGILDRIYSGKQTVYLDCSIDKRWHNFQVFADWYYKNNKPGWALDKDILVKGNKIYGPDTCCYVPKFINTLFVLQKSKRTDLPIGVSKHGNKYRAMFCEYNSPKHLGDYETPIEAFKVYKEHKENYIKQQADLNKEILPDNVYQAMMNYEVEITD